MKKYNIWGVVTLFVMTLVFSGCNNSNKQSSEELEIYYGDKKINIYDGDMSFTKILNKEDGNNLLYVPNNEDITIECNYKKTKKVEITEHILTTKGEYKYEKEGKSIDATKKENDYIFQIRPNVSTMLSSNSEDYNSGEVIKGYHISIDNGKDKKNFCFVIRGDAAVQNRVSGFGSFLHK